MAKITLKELVDLAERANTFGLKPEEVSVVFKHNHLELRLESAEACVSAMPGVAKPTLTIKLTAASTGYDYR